MAQYSWLKISSCTLLVSVISLGCLETQARDIKIEQHNASDARDQYNRAKADYENISAQVPKQQQRVAEEQAKLKKLQDDQVQAQSNLEKSKIDLEAKSKALDAVWDLRDK